MKHTFAGKISDDIVSHAGVTLDINGMRYNRSILENFVDKDLTITIDEKKKPRSVAQNAWYWGVAIPTIIEYLKEYDGIEYDKDVIHEFVLNEIVRVDAKVHRILGRPVITYDNKTTSQMNISEFGVFKNELQNYFAERDIQIPDPNE